MAKKIFAVDSIIGCYVFSWLVWPQLRNALMEQLFCNDFYTQYSDWGFELFGGTCNYAFILFFVIPGIYTAARVFMFSMKVIEWINKNREVIR